MGPAVRIEPAERLGAIALYVQGLTTLAGWYGRCWHCGGIDMYLQRALDERYRRQVASGVSCVYDCPRSVQRGRLLLLGTDFPDTRARTKA